MKIQFKKNDNTLISRITIFLDILILLGIFLFTYYITDSLPGEKVIEHVQYAIGKTTSSQIYGTVNIKNTPIHIVGDARFTMYDFQTLLNSQIDVLLNECSEIYVCDFSEDNICTQQNFDSDKGFFDTNTRIGYLNSDVTNLSHLLASEIILGLNDKYRISYNCDTEEARKIWNEVETLNSNSDDSFFMDIGARYFLYPEEFQREDKIEVGRFFNRSFQKLEGSTNLKDIPVYIEGDVYLSQEMLDQWAENQPNELLANCRAIYVCDPNIETTCSAVHNQNSFPEYSPGGFPDLGGFVIYDNSRIVYLNGISDDLNGCLTHELMHLYDYRNGLSYTERAINLYETKKEYLTEYGQNDIKEFLADAAIYYFQNQDELYVDERIDIYNYFKELFPSYALKQ